MSYAVPAGKIGSKQFFLTIWFLETDNPHFALAYHVDIVNPMVPQKEKYMPLLTIFLLRQTTLVFVLAYSVDCSFSNPHRSNTFFAYLCPHWFHSGD
jgi:hypothetical protein